MGNWPPPGFSYEMGPFGSRCLHVEVSSLRVVLGYCLGTLGSSAPRTVWCFPGKPLLSFCFAGVLCLCSVWWQQSGLLHDVRQDFSSELVEVRW